MHRKNQVPTIFQQIEDEKQYLPRVLSKKRAQLEKRAAECQTIIRKSTHRTQIRERLNAEEEYEQIQIQLSGLDQTVIHQKLVCMQKTCKHAIRPQLEQKKRKREEMPTFHDLLHKTAKTSSIGKEETETEQCLPVTAMDAEFESKLVDWAILRENYGDRDRCPHCQTLLIKSVSEGMLMCEAGCGFITHDIEVILPTHTFRSKCSAPRPTSHKDGNIDELLNLFSPKDFVVIQTEIETIFRDELRTQNPFHEGPITEVEGKAILKKYGKSEDYGDKDQIVAHMNGKPFPVMTEKQRTLIRTMDNMAKCAQTTPLSKKTLLHGLFSLLGMKEYTAYSPLLKSGAKLAKRIETFFEICRANGWPEQFDL